jgi:hypothetical protein
MVRINPDKPPKPWRKQPPQAAAFTIGEFCAAHRLSPSTYYLLQKTGRGPREMKVGARRMISAEAAAKRRKEREAPAQDIA